MIGRHARTAALCAGLSLLAGVPVPVGAEPAAVTLAGPSRVSVHAYVTFRGAVSVAAVAPAPLVEVRLWEGSKELAVTRADADGSFTASVAFTTPGRHAVVASVLDGTPLAERSNVVTVTAVPAMTALDAVARAQPVAKRWASDATLFAVIGAERSPSVPASGVSGDPNAKPQPADRFPCGAIDDDVWRLIDPYYNGEADARVGDGRIGVWQFVYFSTKKNRGTVFIVREGHPVLCVADPLTAQDRVDLRRVRPGAWRTDSDDAIKAVRAHRDVDRALTTAQSNQISYGIDLRQQRTWGLKGSSADTGLTFAAVVDLAKPKVSGLTVNSTS